MYRVLLSIALIVLCTGLVIGSTTVRVGTTGQLVDTLTANTDYEELVIYLSPNIYSVDSLQSYIYSRPQRILFIGDTQEGVIFKCTAQHIPFISFWLSFFGVMSESNNVLYFSNMTIQSCGNVVNTPNFNWGYQTNIEFNNCLIKNNGNSKSPYILIGNSIALVIKNSILHENLGGISIGRLSEECFNSSFSIINSTLSNSDKGIYSVGTPIKIISSSLYNFAGDLITLTSKSIAFISHSNISGIHGQLLSVEMSSVEVISTSFEDNTNNNGVPIEMRDGPENSNTVGLASMRFESCQFNNNKGEAINTPVIYAPTGDSIKIFNSTFQDSRPDITINDLVGAGKEVGEVIVTMCKLNGVNVNYTQTPYNYVPKHTVAAASNDLENLSARTIGIFVGVLCGVCLIVGIIVGARRRSAQINRAIMNIIDSMGLNHTKKPDNSEKVELLQISTDIEESELQQQTQQQLKKQQLLQPQTQQLPYLTNVVLSDKRIGVGFSSEVYEGKMGETKVAVKFVHNEHKLTTISALEELQRKSASPHIVRVYGIMVNSGGKEGIVSEHANFGTLTELFTKPNVDYSLKFAVDLAIQIAEGMCLLSAHPIIVHGDLSTSNVLVHCSYDGTNFDYTLKLNDIGMRSKNYKTGDPNARINLFYTAPEVLHSGVFTLKSDVWSFAVLLCEILGRGSIEGWSSLLERDMYTSLYSGNHPTPPATFTPANGAPEPIPWALQHILLKCFSLAPELRPTFEQLAQELDNIRSGIVDETNIVLNSQLPAILQYLAQQQI